MVFATLATCVSTAGHLACMCVLFTTSLFISAIEWTARFIVSIISTCTGARIDQDHRTPHAERIRTFQDQPDLPDDLVVYRLNTGAAEGGKSGPNQVLDEEDTLKNTVAYAKEQYPDWDSDILGNEAKLTELAKKMISHEFGGDDPSLLAEDFQFVFPVVGPLTKTQFVEAFSKFKVREAFPTASANFYNFKVDPLEPNRIWMLSRGAYEHLGTLNFGAKFPPTGKRICLPPQCFSMSFDNEGKCYKLTGGYNVDRSVGDTKGLGGMFGIIAGLGLTELPFPEGRPWKRSLNWEVFSLRFPQIMEDWKALRG